MLSKVGENADKRHSRLISGACATKTSFVTTPA